MVALAQPLGQGEGPLPGPQAAFVRHRVTGQDPLDPVVAVERLGGGTGRCDHKAGERAIQTAAGGGEQAVSRLPEGQDGQATGNVPGLHPCQAGREAGRGRHGGHGRVEQAAQASDSLGLLFGQGSGGQHQLPSNTPGRFSKKAVVPSLKSFERAVSRYWSRSMKLVA